MRTFLLLLFCAIFLGAANAQDTLNSDHFAPNSATLLLFDLSNQSRITGSLHSTNVASAQLEFIELPISISDLSLSTTHVTAMWRPSDHPIVGYNRQPSISATTLIAAFRVAPGEQETEFGDAFQFNPPGPGLYVVRNGLRTRVYFQSLPARSLNFENMPALEVTPPDTVGFALPSDYEGRIIGNSGQMFSPSPTLTEPIIGFTVDQAASENYIIDFSRPEPGWFGDLTEVVLKLIAVFLPIPLLIFYKPEELNKKLYKWVAGVVIFLIFLAYGGLSIYSYIQGLDLKKIGENALFGVATIVVAFTTYWLTKPKAD